MIALQELKKRINHKLQSGTIPPKVLQSQFRIGFDRPVLLFDDPTYLPFYYHLGKILNKTKNLLEFGFDLGLPSGCFIKNCESIDTFASFRKKTDQYYTKRLGLSNIHNILRKKFDLWIGDESDPEFIKIVLSRKWDCVIICDNKQKEQTYRAYLDLVWNQMMYEGLIIVDFLKEPPVKSAYQSFCKIQNRQTFTIDTSRGTGIIQR